MEGVKSSQKKCETDLHDGILTLCLTHGEHTSIPASLDLNASAIISASRTGMLPAASSRFVAASQLKVKASSSVRGSGECVNA